MGWSMGWDPDGHRTIRRVGVDEFEIIGGFDAPAFMHAPPDSREVVLYHAEGFVPDTLYIRPNQVHITEWESIWSSAFRLSPVPPDEATFAPVIDDNWAVIGHVGWADGSNIVVPEYTIRNGRRFWFLLQKARLDGERQQLLDDEARKERARPFADSALFRTNAKKKAVSRPDPRVDTLLAEAERGPLADRSIEDTYRIDLEKYVTGGGKASVGRNFLERGEALYLPMISGVPDGRLSSPKTLYSSGTQFLVLVDPEGRIQRVMDVRNNIVTYGDLVIPMIELALDLSMIIDIVPLAVVLLAAGVKIATRVMIRAVSAVLDREAKALVEELVVLSASRTLPGMAVSTRGLLPVEHLARRTFIMGEDLAKFRGLMAVARTETGFYDIVIHGDSNSFQILVKTVDGKEIWRNVSVREIADVIKPKLLPGDKIRLLACDVGTTGGPAQELADELNRSVWASTTQVPAVPQGAGVQKAFVPTNGGKFSEFVPSRGAAKLRTGKVTTNEVQGEINAHPRPPGPRR